jgi:hypothetical protein
MPAQPVITDTECTQLMEKTRFIIVRATGKIVSVDRAINEESINLISPNVASYKLIERQFDLQGEPIITVQWVGFEPKKIGDIVPEPDQKGIDGQPLYPLFVQYLKDHNMADRIPDAPPAAPGVVAKP